MSLERRRLSRAAMLTAALIALDIVGTRLLDGLALADRLFAGDAWGIVAGVWAALLLCGRLALGFFLPGYLLAWLVLWSFARKRARECYLSS